MQIWRGEFGRVNLAYAFFKFGVMSISGFDMNYLSQAILAIVISKTGGPQIGVL